MIVSPSGLIAKLSIGDNQWLFDMTRGLQKKPQPERQKKRAKGRGYLEIEGQLLAGSGHELN